MRRFVEDQGVGQAAQVFQGLPALAGLGREKAVEQEMFVEDAGEGERVLKLLLADGLPVKQAAKLAAAITGAAKNALYDRALALKS